MPNKPVPYSQIRQEVMAKRKLKPWEIVVARGHEEDESPEPAGSMADEPMMMAQKRAKLMQGLAPMGEVANPETEAAKKRKKSGSSLMNLLMNVMAR